MGSEIKARDISVRFRKYHGGAGLKEAVLGLLSSPLDRKNRPARKSEFWGLRNISLDLKEGDRLGIIGHNGAGKSTLLKVVSRIYRPTEGTLTVRGRVAPLIELGAGFNPELTGRENTFLNGSILGIPRRVIKSRLDSIVAFAELEEFIDMQVKYYSTGMHLRLAFSIATEVSPDILILDELFAGADRAFIEKANERLDRFIAQTHIFMLVSHEMDYIRRFCNRAILLDHGRLIAAGKPDEIVDRYVSGKFAE